MMGLPGTLYHATPEDNAEGIEKTGILRPSIEGYVHLSISLNKAILFVKVRGIDRVAVFAVDPKRLDPAKLKPLTSRGDDCYAYTGVIRGVTLHASYGPPRPWGGGIATMSQEPRYIRMPEHDRRIEKGNNLAGDAWLDTETGQLIWVEVGHNPNEYARGDSGDWDESQRTL